MEKGRAEDTRTCPHRWDHDVYSLGLWKLVVFSLDESSEISPTFVYFIFFRFESRTRSGSSTCNNRFFFLWKCPNQHKGMIAPRVTSHSINSSDEQPMFVCKEYH